MSKKHLIMTVLVVVLLAAYAVKFLAPSSDEASNESEVATKGAVAERPATTENMADLISEIVSLRHKKMGREMSRDEAMKYVDSLLVMTRKYWMMDENVNTNSVYKEIKDMASKANVGISMVQPTLSRIAKDSPVYLVKVSFHFTDSRGRNASSIPYKDFARFMMEVDRLPHKYEWGNLRVSLDSRDKTKVRVSTAILTTKMIDKKTVAVIREMKGKVHK